MHGIVEVLDLLCAKVFLALQGALWAESNSGCGGGRGGGGAFRVGEILQIFSFFNIHSEDSHILHNERRQYVVTFSEKLSVQVNGPF